MPPATAVSEMANNFTMTVGALPTVNNPNQQDDEKIWTRILSEVSSKSNSTLQGGTVIVLGENQSGKSSLLARLEKNENQGHGSALEYHFLTVQNDFRDGSYAYQLGSAGGLGTADNISLPVWMLDGDETFAPLLQYALPASSPSKAVVVLVASLDNPSLIHSLRRWANLFTQQVNMKYEKSTITEARKLQERFWQEYVEPVESSMTSSMAPGMEDTGLLPLEQGVLTESCGASFIIVLSKSDLGTDLTDQQADRLLVQVRRFCLQLGAALIYTSSKNVKNIQVLYKYIVHRAFGVPFTTPAQMIERDSLFVPAGWDGEKKIDIIKENVPDVEVALEPTRDKQNVIKEQLVEAEDEQIFLQRLAAAENSQPAPQKKQNILEEGTDSSSPLASFFSNLLKDKPGATRPISQPPADSQAQLDRMLKEAAQSKEQQPAQPSSSGTEADGSSA